MWTCPKEYEKKLAGKGYTKSTPHKAVYSEREWEQAKKCFVPCNARATNIYSTRWALANATNIFIQPDMRIYFESGNGERIASGKPPIIVNEDGIATGIMIQWVNRSAIRNGKDVYLYLPSGRMRGLHDRFINNQI